jgi:adenosylmethionine-8-amino-7-oxononanoate aminotransferase
LKTNHYLFLGFDCSISVERFAVQSLRREFQLLTLPMFVQNSSRYLRVLLPCQRKPALTSSAVFHKLEMAPCEGNIRTPIARYNTSAIHRNLEQSVQVDTRKAGAYLYPTLKPEPLNVVSAKGTTVVFSNGKTIEDATCGAAVACVGYDNQRVKNAMIEQMDNFCYSNSLFYGHQIGEELAAELINGTNGEMSKVYLMCSGAEAMESAMKMARQYYMELCPKQPQRTNFIAREGSYHGSTLGALSMGGHVGRRKLFEGMLLDNNVHRVSAANEYRGKADGQTTEEYVQQLADELDRKFQEVGPDTVAAFVAETLVGATLGTVPAPPGYFKAMKNVCDKYGALLILDGQLCQ